MCIVVGLVITFVGVYIFAAGTFITGGLATGLGFIIVLCGLAVFYIGMRLITDKENSENNAVGELDEYLNSNLIGDNSANKLLRESLIMGCFSKICGGKLTDNVPAEKLIQNHNELKSIIETSINPGNNEIKVHAFENGKQ